MNKLFSCLSGIGRIWMLIAMLAVGWTGFAQAESEQKGWLDYVEKGTGVSETVTGALEKTEVLLEKGSKTGKAFKVLDWAFKAKKIIWDDGGKVAETWEKNDREGFINAVSKLASDILSTAGSIGGGALGGLITGILGIETGPGALVIAVLGGIAGSEIGEKLGEELYKAALEDLIKRKAAEYYDEQKGGGTTPGNTAGGGSLGPLPGGGGTTGGGAAPLPGGGTGGKTPRPASKMGSLWGD